MRILILQDDLHEYLAFVVKSHAHRGVEPSEGLALYQLNLAVNGAQQVDEKQLAKITVPPSGEASVKVEPKANEPLPEMPDSKTGP